MIRFEDGDTTNEECGLLLATTGDAPLAMDEKPQINGMIENEPEGLVLRPRFFEVPSPVCCPI